MNRIQKEQLIASLLAEGDETTLTYLKKIIEILIEETHKSLETTPPDMCSRYQGEIVAYKNILSLFKNKK